MTGIRNYFLRSAEDHCQNCDEPLSDHDKERVSHDDGTWSYDYYCTDGSRFDSPIDHGDEE